MCEGSSGRGESDRDQEALTGVKVMAFLCQPRKVLQKGTEGGQKGQGRGRAVSRGRRSHLIFSDVLDCLAQFDPHTNCT